MYRQQRDYENLNKQIYKGSGEFGIPDILPEDPIDVESWVGFNYAKTCRSPEGKGVHFFLDDYQFSRVWTNVDAYIPLLRKFRVVMAPRNGTRFFDLYGFPESDPDLQPLPEALAGSVLAAGRDPCDTYHLLVRRDVIRMVLRR